MLLCFRPWCVNMDLFVDAGSPFLVTIGGEPSGRITERIVRQKEAADITHIGSQCELSLKIPGIEAVLLIETLRYLPMLVKSIELLRLEYSNCCITVHAALTQLVGASPAATHLLKTV